jgi:hypothetical protein
VKNIFVHPFLLSLIPVLHMYADNIEDVYFPWKFFGAILLCVGIVIVAGMIVVRDGAKVSLLATLISAWFFWAITLGAYLARPLIRVFSASGGSEMRLIMASLAFVMLGVYVWRTKRNLIPLNKALSIGATVLIALGSVSVFSAFYDRYEINALVNTTLVPFDRSGWQVAKDPATQPNIVYIIMDARAGSKTLESIYEYSDGEFIAGLDRLGFDVVDKPTTNYGNTVMSLSSSLNGEYLNHPDSIQSPRQKYSFAIASIEQNRIARVLREMGYVHVHVDSGYKATGSSRVADLVLSPRHKPFVSEFVATFMRTTMFCQLDCRQLAKKWYQARILFSLDTLDTIEEADQPIFVFLHLIAPHGPSVFDHEGNDLPPLPEEAGRRSVWNDRHEYLEQLQYVDKRVLGGVESLLKRFVRPTIVVIQSDHGPSLTWGKGNKYSDPLLLRERMSILNSFYLPGDGAGPKPDITPINSFRYILNRHFDAGLPMLPNINYRSYYRGAIYNRPQWDHVEITELLQQTDWQTIGPPE